MMALDEVLMVLGGLAVGVSIGLVGIGGVFLIPLLVLLGGLSIQTAIGTALLTFVAAGAAGTALYARHGAIDWRTAWIVGVGSLAFGPVGAKVSLALPEAAVSAVFAGFLLLVGLYTLVETRQPRRSRKSAAPARPLGSLALLGCGALVGFGSGLTGAGGAAILVPLLLLLRQPVTTAVGVSQVNVVAASGAGALGHLWFGHVDLRLAALLGAAEVVGACVGAALARRVGASGLRPLVAALCIAVAAWIVARTWLGV